MLLSIIVPVCNSKDYIKSCIESIIGPSNDYEVIIVDDESTDETPTICQELQASIPNIKYYRISKGGVSSARNYGLSVACGDYVTFIDADDQYKKNAILMIIDNLLEHPDILYFGYQKFDNVSVKEKVYGPITNSYKMNGLLYFESELRNGRDLTRHVWTCVYSKRVIKDVLFDTHLTCGEDFEFNLKAFSRAEFVITLSDGLYLYNISNSQSATKTISLKRLISEMSVCNYWLASVNEHKFLRQYLSNFFMNSSSVISYIPKKERNGVVDYYKKHRNLGKYANSFKYSITKIFYRVIGVKATTFLIKVIRGNR